MVGLPLEFSLWETLPCNLSMVREFYANMKVEAHSQVVILWGILVNITLVTINAILGTRNVSIASFTELQICLLDRAIHHTLAGVTSTAKWIHHGYKRYHHSFPFAPKIIL